MSAATHHTNHWTTSHSDWWHAVSWGIAGVIVGLFLMTQPIASAIILMTVLAGFLVLGGVVDILHAVVNNTEGWLWHIGGGVLIIFGGAVVLGRPLAGTAITAVMLYLILSLATIGSGLITLLEPHGRSWVSIVLGVLQIAIGVALLAAMLGVLTLAIVIQAIGVVAVAGGFAAIASALRSSNRAHAAV